jgi:hypothetical protein
VLDMRIERDGEGYLDFLTNSRISLCVIFGVSVFNFWITFIDILNEGGVRCLRVMVVTCAASFREDFVFDCSTLLVISVLPGLLPGRMSRHRWYTLR